MVFNQCKFIITDVRCKYTSRQNSTSILLSDHRRNSTIPTISDAIILLNLPPQMQICSLNGKISWPSCHQRQQLEEGSCTYRRHHVVSLRRSLPLQLSSFLQEQKFPIPRKQIVWCLSYVLLLIQRTSIAPIICCKVA